MWMIDGSVAQSDDKNINEKKIEISFKNVKQNDSGYFKTTTKSVAKLDKLNKIFF